MLPRCRQHTLHGHAHTHTHTRTRTHCSSRPTPPPYLLLGQTLPVASTRPSTLFSQQETRPRSFASSSFARLLICSLRKQHVLHATTGSDAPEEIQALLPTRPACHIGLSPPVLEPVTDLQIAHDSRLCHRVCSTRASHPTPSHPRQVAERVFGKATSSTSDPALPVIRGSRHHSRPLHRSGACISLPARPPSCSRERLRGRAVQTARIIALLLGPY